MKSGKSETRLTEYPQQPNHPHQIKFHKAELALQANAAGYFHSTFTLSIPLLTSPFSSALMNSQKSRRFRTYSIWQAVKESMTADFLCKSCIFEMRK